MTLLRRAAHFQAGIQLWGVYLFWGVIVSQKRWELPSAARRWEGWLSGPWVPRCGRRCEPQGSVCLQGSVSLRQESTQDSPVPWSPGTCLPTAAGRGDFPSLPQGLITMTESCVLICWSLCWGPFSSAESAPRTGRVMRRNKDGFLSLGLKLLEV